MKMKRLVVWLSVINLLASGAWLVVRPNYRIVSLVEGWGPPPSMPDDETVTFQSNSEGVYRAISGRLERLSAMGDELADSRENCYAVVGERTYYVRKAPPPELVVCEKGGAQPVSTEEDTGIIRNIQHLHTDGSTLIFVAEYGRDSRHDGLAYRDGKFTNIFQEVGFPAETPRPILRDFKKTFLSPLPSPSLVPTPQESAGALVGDLEQHVLSGGRYVMLGDEGLAAAEGGRFAKLVAVGDQLSNGRVDHLSNLCVSGRNVTILVAFDGPERRYGIYRFGDKERNLIATSRPSGEYGYSYGGLSTNSDHIAVVEYNGHHHADSRIRRHRLAFLEYGYSRPVLTTGELLNGKVVYDISLGPNGVSPGGSVAFRYQCEGGGEGIAIATPRRWDAMVCAFIAVAAASRLVWEFLMWRKNRAGGRI